MPRRGRNETVGVYSLHHMLLGKRAPLEQSTIFYAKGRFDDIMTADTLYEVLRSIAQE